MNKKKFQLYMRILLFLFFLFFHLIIIGPLLLLTYTINTKLHCIEKKFMCYFYLFILKSKINISLKKNMDESKKYLIMSNHHTALDYFVLNYIFHNSYTVVKSDILSQRKDSNLLVKIINYIQYLFFKSGMLISYVRRDKLSGIETKKNIINSLINKNVIIFPEGSSTRNGIPKKFKKGIFYLAFENNISILPCSLKYNNSIGIDSKGKLNLEEWINNEIHLQVHEEINPNNFENALEMMDYTFKTITSSLL